MATKRHSLSGNYRYHESLNNVTPADVYLGKHTAIIESRQKI
jgi:hypothetical protein